MKARGKIPPKIANAPQLEYGLELFYLAFHRLTGARGAMGEGPILFSEIASYARFFDLDQETTDDLLHYLGAMDRVWMNHMRKKNPSGGGAQGTPGKKIGK
jgi:hypothetical protein